MAQPSLSHEGSPWFELHLCRHIWQSSTLVRSVSHWSSSSPLQSAVPGSQPIVAHCPPAQKFEAQVSWHLPQFFGSSVTGVSQPLEASPSHSAVPGAHGPSPQTPFQHAPPASQAWPQPPQLVASVSGF
jgi:hypothetical protein